MSLRNGWERVVPLGSLLSGLFCVLRDFPSDADAHLSPAQKRHVQ